MASWIEVVVAMPHDEFMKAFRAEVKRQMTDAEWRLTREDRIREGDVVLGTRLSRDVAGSLK